MLSSALTSIVFIVGLLIVGLTLVATITLVRVVLARREIRRIMKEK